MKKILNLVILLTVLLLSACKPRETALTQIQGPALDPIHQRLATGVIYEVNIRQITPEGTFKAFTEQHIPRLKKLGVDVLWLMPIYPISVKNRKGSLGSYYSVADYTGVNPAFGTLDDLKDLVNKAHAAGMLVILDWVPNHSGWDNHWIKEHPDWYTHNKQGKIISPTPDWTDVADLNYDNPGLRKAMTDAMKYWIKEVGIDGYRCDAAAMVPIDFWHDALAKLDSIHPIIKLAEAWEPALLANGFDAAYGWDLYHLMNDLAKGTKKVKDLNRYFQHTDSLYKPKDMLMNFISNHDENSWSGTVYERLGAGVRCFTAFTYLVPGIPLIYDGQEASMKKRLRFFEKDTISWNDTTLYGFYRALDNLKHQHPSLEAGLYGGKFSFSDDTLSNTCEVIRTAGQDIVVGLFNMSDKSTRVKFTGQEDKGTYRNVLTGNKVKVEKSGNLSLGPWEFVVLVKQ